MVNLTLVRVKQSMMNNHKVAQHYSSFFPRWAATDQDTSTKPQHHYSCKLYKLIASWVPLVWDETVSSLCRWQIWGFEIYTYSCIRLFFNTRWTKRRKKNSWVSCCIHRVTVHLSALHEIRYFCRGETTRGVCMCQNGTSVWLGGCFNVVLQRKGNV